jgi:sulfonate transport system permease protein
MVTKLSLMPASALAEGETALPGEPIRVQSRPKPPANVMGSNWRTALVRCCDSRASHICQYIAMPLTILLIWQLMCRTSLVSPVALPSPFAVGTTLWKLIYEGHLLVDVYVSIVRVLEGFGIAVSLALPLGVAIGISRTLARITDLFIQCLRPIPPIAWIPLAILWFGIGETSKIFIIFLGAFFPIVINVMDGIRQTDHRYVELADVLEVTWWRFIRKVVLPGALPSIMTGLRVGLGTAWVCVVAAELIAAESGVGYIIVDGRELSQPDVVIAGMIVIGVIGKLMDVLLKRLEVHLVPWKTPYEGA